MCFGKRGSRAAQLRQPVFSILPGWLFARRFAHRSVRLQRAYSPMGKLYDVYAFTSVHLALLAGDHDTLYRLDACVRPGDVNDPTDCPPLCSLTRDWPDAAPVPCGFL